MNFRDLFGCGSSSLQKELKPSALGGHSSTRRI